MDLFAASRDAIEAGSPLAYGLALLFGIASSFGPCAASRVVVVAGIAQGQRRTGAIIGSFLAGIVAVYILFAFALHAIGVAQILQSEILVLAASAFLIAAVVTFVLAYRADDGCDHRHVERPARSALAAFCAGTISALNVSPCCTPWLIMALTYSSAQGNAVYGAALMTVFAIGHGLPLLAYGGIARRAAALIEGWGLRRAMPLANTALLLFLSIYYAVQI
jgi:cytochrome c-type biogenesis protein